MPYKAVAVHAAWYYVVGSTPFFLLGILPPKNVITSNTVLRKNINRDIMTLCKKILADE